MAISGARPATRFGPFGRSRPRPRTVAQPRRRMGAGRRSQRVGGVPGVLIGIAAAAGLAFFHLSPSSHVAATGYEIADLRAQLAELRAEQQQLILQIGENRSPAVIERRAKSTLYLVTLPPSAVTFAQPSTKDNN
jgi:cell division protein FtsL